MVIAHIHAKCLRHGHGFCCLWLSAMKKRGVDLKKVVHGGISNKSLNVNFRQRYFPSSFHTNFGYSSLSCSCFLLLPLRTSRVKNQHPPCIAIVLQTATAAGRHQRATHHRHHAVKIWLHLMFSPSHRLSSGQQALCKYPTLPCMSIVKT